MKRYTRIANSNYYISVLYECICGVCVIEPYKLN